MQSVISKGVNMVYKFNAGLIDRILIDLENKWLDYTDKVWNAKPHRIVCQICGDTLVSQGSYSHSPEQCGWERIKGKKMYICHRCLCHRNFKPYIKKIDGEDQIKTEYMEKLNEIRTKVYDQYDSMLPYNICCAEGLAIALDIIDEYVAESEDKE